MTLKSVLHHFYDKHAQFFSHKMFFSVWCEEVTSTEDRPVEKVELCSGTTFQDYSSEDWETDIRPYDRHGFLQITLSETAHHPQRTILLERTLGGDREPHAAIPIPEDIIARMGTVTGFAESLDCVCVLTHGSHGRDVVHELEVVKMVHVDGRVSLHELVSVLGPAEKKSVYGVPYNMNCQDLAATFGMGCMHVMEVFMQQKHHHDHHHHHTRDGVAEGVRY